MGSSRLAYVFLFAIVLIAGTMGARAQVEEGLKALIQLNDRVIALYNVGKFAEALPLPDATST